MNVAYAHLALNHIPILGLPFVLLSLTVAHFKKSEELKNFSLQLLVLIAVLTLPAYLTGEPAEKMLKPAPWFDKPTVHAHEDAALYGFVMAEIIGGLALLSLALKKKVPFFASSAFLKILFFLILLSSIAFMRIAHLGGEIRHDEIRGTSEGSSAFFSPVATALAQDVSSDQRFAMLANEYIESLFRFRPSMATTMGVHQYDPQFESYSKEAIQKRVSELKVIIKKFEALKKSSLSKQSEIDYDVTLSAVRAELFDLDEFRMWERNPDFYSARAATDGVFSLISRDFAPAETRLRSLVFRLRKVPTLIEQAKANLKNPPRIYTEIALEQIAGIVSFFNSDVPAAFKSVKDESLLAEFKEANQAAVLSLVNYQKFLKEDLLPRSKGNFKLGERKYRQKLLLDEMVSTPLKDILKAGYQNLKSNQEWIKKAAHQIDPNADFKRVLEAVEKDHPVSDKLLQSFRDVLGGLKEFVVDHKIMSIAGPTPPILQETPPFLRALTFASMDNPGPYETNSKDAFFSVTLPEKDWPKSRVEQHMAAFSFPTLTAVAIHEAYPGHYAQFQWLKDVRSPVRKVFMSATNAEGWAHYTEQMMLDEGYGDNDPKLRMGQLYDALLRNSRLIVAMEMHTGKMTFDQGVEFFMKEGFQSKANAERETKRATVEPVYVICYTLGKLHFMKFREDYKKRFASEYSILKFHDEIMKYGLLPISQIRRSVLGEVGSIL